MSEDKPGVECSVEYSTEWFELVAKRLVGEPKPYYSLRMPDYVSVVALTASRELVFVRQYRPAVEQYTLELPGGHVDPGEKPEESAERELLEETGFTSSELEFLGTLRSDTGRNENRLWCYLAPDAQRMKTGWTPEPGVEVSLVPIDGVHDSILRGDFDHALNISALMLALLRRERCLPRIFPPQPRSDTQK